MSQNIVKSLEQRQINNQFNPEKFFKANYFNESMLKRFKVENKIKIECGSSDDLVSCGSWNCDGILLGCGKVGKGIEIYTPFRNNKKVTTVPINQDHYLEDVVFMPKTKHLMAVTSRNKNNLVFWNTPPDLPIDNYVKIWDVEKNAATRMYSYKETVTKLVTSIALPNHIWFNTDNKVETIAEADIRSPKYKVIKLGLLQYDSLVYRRCFDVHPVDEVTIAVGDRNRLLFYDRRTLTSQSFAQTVKSIDVSSINRTNSYISEIRYNYCGSKIVFGNSSYDHYIVPVSDLFTTNIKGLPFKSLINTVSRNPKFLGHKYVLFDTFYKNYSVVFDLDEAKLIGKIKLSYQRNYFSNIFSIPHPIYCIIVIIYQDIINFITPTNTNHKK